MSNSVDLWSTSISEMDISRHAVITNYSVPSVVILQLYLFTH